MRVVALLLLALPISVSAQWYSDPPRQTVVAVIDSGVDCSLFDCVDGWDFVDNDNTPFSSANQHGTNTTGILDDLATNIKIMPLRVLNNSGISTEQQLVDAINFARDNGADIIQAVILVSSTWGISCFDQLGCMPNLCDAIANAGLLFIGASGNEGLDLTQVVRYPPICNTPNMIIVGGTDRNDLVFTSFPNDIYAPGEDINLRTGGVGTGGSYATPQVTATAVIEYQTNPDLNPLQLKAEVLEHQSAGILNTFYPPELLPPPPPPPVPGLLLDISATINISDIDRRNPIQTKQGSPERGYTFEVPAGNSSRALRMENWPSGATSPHMIDGQTTLQENITYDVRLTHDGTTVRLYLDGVLEAEVNSPPPRSNSQPVRDCRYRWSSSYDKFFNGSCTVQ